MKHTKYWKYLKYSAIIFWSSFIIYMIWVNVYG